VSDRNGKIGPGEKSGGGESNVVILRAFLANLGIAIAKFVAAAMTGSSAMLTEGVHSLIDTTNQALLWLGEKRAAKPPDKLHPMGYGREQYFWSVIVAMLIFGLGAGVSLYEGFEAISHPEETRQSLVAFGVLAFALALEGWSLRTAWREFDARRRDGESLRKGIRNTKDTTTLVVLLEDSAAVIGVVIAAAGIGLELLTGNAMWDGVASLGIGGVLSFVAVTLLRESKDLLIGEAADPELVAAIRQRVERGENVEYVEEVITIHLAPERVVAVVCADFCDDLAVGDLERTIAAMEENLREQYPVLERVYLRPVGAEPA
jgi:cation diffusion facilitator family transporter